MTLYWYIAHHNKHTVLLVSVSTGFIGGAGLGLALHGPAPARWGLGSRAPYMERPARPERVAVRLTHRRGVETLRSTQRHPNMDEDREEFQSNALTFLHGCPKSCKSRDGYIRWRESLCTRSHWHFRLTWGLWARADTGKRALTPEHTHTNDWAADLLFHESDLEQLSFYNGFALVENFFVALIP